MSTKRNNRENSTYRKILDAVCGKPGVIYDDIRTRLRNDREDIGYQIEAMLGEVAARLEDQDVMKLLGIRKPLFCEVHWSSNRVDRPVDRPLEVWLTIAPIPIGVSMEKLFTVLEMLCQPVPRTYVSTGMLFAPESTDSLLARFKGINGTECLNPCYVEAEQQALNFWMAREIAHCNMKAARRKPYEVTVRLHWNPLDLCPERNGRFVLPVTPQTPA